MDDRERVDPCAGTTEAPRPVAGRDRRALELEDVSLQRRRPLGAGADSRSSFRPGEVTALSGPSGSGKTTLLSIAGGIREADDRVRVVRRRPHVAGRRRPAARGRVRAAGLRPGADPECPGERRDRAAGPRRDAERAPTSAPTSSSPASTSATSATGRSRSCPAARCSASPVRARSRSSPGILLADEPTSELDEGNREHVMDQLRAEAARGAIVVVATHDPAVVEAADRRLVLDEGRLLPGDAARRRDWLGRRAPPQHPGPPGSPRAPRSCSPSWSRRGCRRRSSARPGRATRPARSPRCSRCTARWRSPSRPPASTVDRSHDVALARLRGMTGLRLVSFAAAPLLAVSLVGHRARHGSPASGWPARSPTGWHTSYTPRHPRDRGRASRCCSAPG